jgi:Cys-tRNA(Pro) deacylase
MSKIRLPSTPALRFLREHQVEFVPHLYQYRGGGAKGSASALGLEPMRVAKTLIFEITPQRPLVVIMNGPYETSLKALARDLDVKQITPAPVERAELLTGYRVGGISPFGHRRPSPCYMQKDLFDLETILVNGGQRGFLVEIAPSVIQDLLQAKVVDIAIRPKS